MAKFRRYSPYNNMLVKVQNPHCSFYASKYDWYNRFGRQIKEDAKPMLILAPMYPVMLVYDLDEPSRFGVLCHKEKHKIKPKSI